MMKTKSVKYKKCVSNERVMHKARAKILRKIQNSALE